MKNKELQHLKDSYRKYYVEVLIKENNRGYTTYFEKNKLEWYRKQIREGENNAKPKLNNR
tara:strand:- start:2431 stop:2610 length:180 start_codon:yes stop_codon:yes gene_type:complete